MAIRFRVWCEHVPQLQGAVVEAKTPLGAVLRVLGMAVDEWTEEDEVEKDDYFVRENCANSPILRFRALVEPSGVVAESLRTCRKCGCTDDRACHNGCSWVAPDLCSECEPDPQPKPTGRRK